MEFKFSFDDLYLFQLLVQHQGINAAASVSGIPAATLSRRLKRLEQALGCRLLDRNAHRFTLTDVGQRYYAQCHPLFADLQGVTSALNDEQHGLHGTLKITSPVSMGQHWLRDCFFEFSRLYPDIHLELVLSNKLESLVDERFDAAFRIGAPHETSWVARQVSTSHMGLAASREYLSSNPVIEHPKDLLQHKLVAIEPSGEWDLRHGVSNEEFLLIPEQSVLRTNDFNLAVDAIKAGMGVGMIPSYYFPCGSEESTLVPLLPEWRGRQRSLYLLYRDVHTLSARLRAFVDFVVDWMANDAAAKGAVTNLS